MLTWVKSTLDAHNLLMYALIYDFTYAVMYKTHLEIAAVGVVLCGAFGIRTYYGIQKDGPNV